MDHISERNRLEAQRNIDDKIEFYRKVLNEIRTAENTSKVNITLPKSLRGFNSWERLNIFVSNAADTLRKDANRTRVVQLLINEYRNIKSSYKRKNSRSDFQEMKSNFDVTRAQLLSVEHSFAESRIELASLRYKCETFIAQKKSLESEFSEMKKAYSARVLELEIENKELRVKLSKVFPLKKTK